MARTRFRSDQGIDEEFLTEEEGAERFIFRDGYGTNNAGIVLDDGYTLTIDGYQVYPLKVSDTSSSTEVFSVKEIELNDAYGLIVVDAGAGKVRIDLGSSGTIVPTVRLGPTAQALTFGVGRYTKVGNSAIIAINISFSKSGTGDLSIEGLPFLSDPTANLTQVLPAHLIGITGNVYGGPTYGTGGSGAKIQGNLAPNETTIFFKAADSATNVTDALLDATTTITVTGSYLTT